MTDMAGHFVVEDSPQGVALTVEVPERPLTTSRGWEFKESGYVDHAVYADLKEVQVETQGKEDLNLGTIYADGRRADSQFVQVCEGRPVAKAPLQTLLFKRDKLLPWHHDGHHAGLISRNAELIIGQGVGVLCVTEKEDVVGRYTNGALAYQKSLLVTLVRWPSNKRVKKSFSTSPPLETRNQYSGSRDPYFKLVAWLKKIQQQ